MQKLIFYSIGENCLAQGVLKRHGIDAPATPFSHARSNIDYLNELVSEDFEDFLNPDYLEYDKRYGTQMVINKKYKSDAGFFDHSVSNYFEFSHHDVITDKSALESYRRKTSRFLEVVKGSTGAFFVYHSRLHEGQDVSRVTGKLAQFLDKCKTFSSRPLGALLFTQRLVGRPEDRDIEFYSLDGVSVAVLSTQELWGGSDMDVFWGKNDDDLFATMIAEISRTAI